MWKKVIFVVFLIVFLSSTLPLHQAMGQTTTLSVQPTNSFGINAGDTFSINITVSNVIDLDGWQFSLYYQSAVLNASTYLDPRGEYHLNATEGDFLKAGGSSTYFSAVNFTDHYNATFGVVTLNSLRFSIPTGVNGSGNLVSIKFNAVGSGPSVLHFDNGFLPMKLFDSANHLISFTPIDGVAYSGAVDVAIGKIDTPLDIPQGSMALINVTAQNRGQPTETFDVTLTYNGNPIDGTKTVVDLPGGGSQILNYAWDTTSIPIGKYTLTATASMVPGQMDLSDLTLSVNVYVGTIDVAITGVNTKTSIPAGFNGTEVDVTVQNGGQATETLNVTLSVNSHSVDNQTTTLNPGTSGTVALWWNTTELGYGNYTVQVFMPPLQFQTDTSNNNFTTTAAVTIPGDLNGDFTVGLSDLVILAQAYGSRQGNSNWKANADIDSNGAVGLTDLVILAQHYGQHVP
jgi:hypothetical protein